MNQSIFKKIYRWIVPPPVKVAKISYISPNSKLKGKRILVTGGTGGIGRAMAKRFVDEGARVLITGRNQDKLKKVATEIGCEALELDLRKVDSFGGVVSSVLEKLGGIDCLVNNAGISLHEKSLEKVTLDGFNQQFETNFRGPFFLTQKVLPHIVKNGSGGKILFISSETGDTVDFRPYGLTKIVINSFVQGLAHLYSPYGVTVNAISPGVTATDMTGFQPDENLYCSFNPVGRVYLPEEMAEVAVFMLSDASNIISGQIITCNHAKTVNARWKE
jgi:NAD(P)-dependent dehydrogenase (short-subunit alcohol dehydrogenase family)